MGYGFYSQGKMEADPIWGFNSNSGDLPATDLYLRILLETLSCFLLFIIIFDRSELARA